MNTSASQSPLSVLRGGTRSLETWPIISELESARNAWTRGASTPERPKELLSRKAVLEIVDGLKAVLFPLHYGRTDLLGGSVNYFVGDVLDVTLRTLSEQIRRCLLMAADSHPTEGRNEAEEAVTLTHAFAQQLPAVRLLLNSDIEAAFRGDPAATSLDEILFCYPGFNAITHHRLAHILYRLGLPILARLIAELAHSATGIDIHPGATIGQSFFIDHGTGVVIGETAILGEGIRLYQGVTLGALSFPKNSAGAVIKGVPRHPILEDDVVVYAGATLLGRITVGRGSSIGGNVWLTKSVPPGSRLTQAVARNELFSEGSGI